MRIVASFLCLCSIVLPQLAIGQADPEIVRELEELCQQVLCRESAPVRLKLPGEKTLEVPAGPPTPIMAGDLVTVFPGETVMIEARVENGRLVGLTAVSEVADPKRTLSFRLVQEPSIGDGTGMVLRVDSPFSGVLKYRLGMMLPTGDDLLKTSSCPLRGGVAVYEHWVHPIFQIVATDFRFVDPDSADASTCE